MGHERIVGICCALLLTAACVRGGGRAGHDARPTGGPEWPSVSPAAAGLDVKRLDAIAAQAGKGKSNCLAVVRNGKLAREWYFRGTGPDSTQNIYSATKSVTSVLVGIAQDDGVLHVGDSASKWIPEWKGTPAQAVTVRDLLSMDSGREWSVRVDYAQLLRARDRTAFAVGLKQQRPPGQVWAYNNSAVQTLQRVLQKATGQDVAEYARERLFEPLGMARTAMTTDRAGNAQMFMGVRSTCRDMARLGSLMLDHGTWNGRRIVSAGWVEQATGHSSTRLNAAYGYLWWLNRPGTVAGPLSATDLGAAGHPTTVKGPLVHGAPQNMFWALGLGNQLVQVDPGSGTVVVRLGTPEPRPRPPTFGPAEAAKVVTEALVHP
ncbi:serine hydrolase [Actinoallomurus bryophytorum]|uniref:CubicO group peptidase (Beta-lactamase class C family) n=1 Tax=Actinoallomurus bryophytorum TaxID=1490222 RepID=A0A543C031_9ACTN|nr:serine hydrolase [Actinoallomurus bryophytorum]TQL90425.1 CubicO group peptidase (beta-lactamase class C family) [Actinoallomurus bryophytorum]